MNFLELERGELPGQLESVILARFYFCAEMALAFSCASLVRQVFWHRYSFRLIRAP